MNINVIGVAGASGSGKTTLAKELNNHFGEESVIISSDYYYKGATADTSTRDAKNFDHPDSIDFILLIDHLQQLKKGQAIDMPTYDFLSSSRTPKTIRIDPKPIIIVEGILIFHLEALRVLFDAKLFVKTAKDFCFIRRLERDIKECGRTHDQVVSQYLATVRPMYLEFLKPCQKYAHGVFENNEPMSKIFNIASIISLLESIKATPLIDQSPKRFKFFTSTPLLFPSTTPLLFQPTNNG